jgi:hypothetical protein
MWKATSFSDCRAVTGQHLAASSNVSVQVCRVAYGVLGNRDDADDIAQQVFCDLDDTMSCRIERLISAEDFVVLHVSGRMQAEHVDTLRELLGREKGGVAIDLAEVLLVDREAVKLLAFSEANGLELRNCPAYIREWVARERAHPGAELSDLKTGAINDVEDL